VPSHSGGDAARVCCTAAHSAPAIRNRSPHGLHSLTPLLSAGVRVYAIRNVSCNCVRRSAGMGTFRY